MSTPNIVSVKSKVKFVLRDRFHHLSDIPFDDHISPITPVQMSRICVEVGLELVQIAYSNVLMLPWSDSVRLQAAFRFLKGERFSEHYMAVIAKG